MRGKIISVQQKEPGNTLFEIKNPVKPNNNEINKIKKKRASISAKKSGLFQIF